MKRSEAIEIKKKYYHRINSILGPQWSDSEIDDLSVNDVDELIELGILNVEAEDPTIDFWKWLSGEHGETTKRKIINKMYELGLGITKE